MYTSTSAYALQSLRYTTTAATLLYPWATAVVAAQQQQQQQQQPLTADDLVQTDGFHVMINFDELSTSENGVGSFPYPYYGLDFVTDPGLATTENSLRPNNGQKLVTHCEDGFISSDLDIVKSQPNFLSAEGVQPSIGIYRYGKHPEKGAANFDVLSLWIKPLGFHYEKPVLVNISVGDPNEPTGAVTVHWGPTDRTPVHLNRSFHLKEGNWDKTDEITFISQYADAPDVYEVPEVGIDDLELIIRTNDGSRPYGTEDSPARSTDDLSLLNSGWTVNENETYLITFDDITTPEDGVAPFPINYAGLKSRGSGFQIWNGSGEDEAVISQPNFLHGHTDDGPALLRSQAFETPYMPFQLVSFWITPVDVEDFDVVIEITGDTLERGYGSTKTSITFPKGDRAPRFVDANQYLIGPGWNDVLIVSVDGHYDDPEKDDGEGIGFGIDDLTVRIPRRSPYCEEQPQTLAFGENADLEL